MTLNDYLVAFRQGWWIVLGALVVGLGVASVIVLRQPTVYSASTQLFVTATVQVPRNGTSDWYDVAGSRVISYATLAGGDLVGDRVADLLGGEPEATVSVAAVPNTVIISVLAQGSDQQAVADVANAYAEVLPEVVEEVEEREGGTQVEMTPTARAEVPTSPDARPLVPTLASAGLLGLGLGCGLVILRDVLRRERRGEDRRSHAELRP